MKDNLNKFLEDCSGNTNQEVWAIKYNGSFLRMPSGKSSWNSIGSAKNAWHNGVAEWHRQNIGGWLCGQPLHDFLKVALEEKLIEFVNLYQYELQTMCDANKR